MARTSIRDGRLVVEFRVWERLFTLRARVEVPLSAIRGVRRVRQPLTATRGARFAGVEVLGMVKAGIWGVGAGTRQLVCVRRGQPALRISLPHTEDFDELLVSAPEEIAAAFETVSP